MEDIVGRGMIEVIINQGTVMMDLIDEVEGMNPKSHRELHCRKNGEYESYERLERPIEGEVPCRARMNLFDQHGGGDMNQTFMSSSCKGTSSSFHTPKVSLGLYSYVSSSRIYSNVVEERNEGKRKRLASKSEPTKPRECKKRLECKMQKSRESGEG